MDFDPAFAVATVADLFVSRFVYGFSFSPADGAQYGSHLRAHLLFQLYILKYIKVS